MYIATQDFKSYFLGDIKKGQDIEYKKTWLDSGLIEIKPEPKAVIETKPARSKKKSTK
jgi:hypothetical protein